MCINKVISYTVHMGGMANINVYSSEFLIISIRNIHYLILRESELGIKEKAHSMGWLCRESEELRNKQNLPNLSFFSCQQTCTAH